MGLFEPERPSRAQIRARAREQLQEHRGDEAPRPVAERELVREIRQLRAWTFWGPFWAILATGAIGAVLYLAAVAFFVAAS